MAIPAKQKGRSKNVHTSKLESTSLSSPIVYILIVIQSSLQTHPSKARELFLSVWTYQANALQLGLEESSWISDEPANRQKTEKQKY